MNTVEAVKSKEDIRLVGYYLAKHNTDELYADIWKTGINVSLRISDLLGIKYSDLDTDKSLLKLVEQKTGKTKEIRLNKTVKEVIQKRRKAHPEDIYLFETHSNRSSGKPVSRQMVARKFKEVGEIMNLNLSTHSMRKTRGYAMHIDGRPIELISKVLNHSTPAVTMNYLGITREDILNTYDDYEL